MQVKEINTEEKTKFQPFTFSITVENENELLELLGRFNVTSKIIKEKGLSEIYSVNLVKEYDASEHDTLVYSYLKEKALEYKLAQ